MYKSYHNRIIGLIVSVIIIVIVISGIYAVVTHKITFVNTPRYNWKIRFDNLRNVETMGMAKEINKPTINTQDTSISSYSVSLVIPGDSISYTFDVVNDGDYNAFISSVNIPKPVCHGIGNNSTNDAKNVCSNLKYTLKYLDGRDVKIGDQLKKRERKTMILKLSYSVSTNPKELAKNDLIIDHLNVDIFYTQCDKKNC